MISNPTTSIGNSIYPANLSYNDVKIKTLESTLGSMQKRFAPGQKAWNPSEPKNHALGYAFKKHMTPIVQALVKPGDLTDEDKTKLQSMKDVIDYKLTGNPFYLSEVPAAEGPYGPKGNIREIQRLTGGRRKLRKTRSNRKTKSRKSRK